MIELLNRLYERGFYRKLSLSSCPHSNKKRVNQLAAMNGLNKLVSMYVDGLSALKNIEELTLGSSEEFSDLDMVAKILINLKIIRFLRARIDDLLPFLKRSVNMQKIKVEFLKWNTIDFWALNREREKLPGAEKTTLYLKEEIYLETKWTMKETDFGLIRLKRMALLE